MTVVIPLLVMCSIIVLFYGTLYIIGPDEDVEERLVQGHFVEHSFRSHNQPSPVSRELGQRIGLGRYGARLRLELAQAGIQMKVGEFLLINVGLFFGALIVGSLVSKSIMGGIGLASLALVMPRVWLKRKKEKRIATFQEQLPDVLNLIVGSLRAGYGLIQAMKLVAQEMPSPSREEYERVSNELSLGISLHNALGHLVERMESEDLALVVTAINIQHEVGGNLGNILDTISDTIRERVRVQGEIRTMTSMQRMTGYMLAAMPFFVAAILMVLNPGYIMQLFVFPWIFIPIGALVSMSLGIVFMNKLLQIDL
jgi:tight adherence protein B